MRDRLRRSQPGFTLIELMVVILIIGLLATIVVQNLKGATDKAKRALVETYNRRSKIGLVGASFDVASGKWLDTDSHIGGGIDSYYEYLWKCWKLFDDKDCLAMWQASIAAINRHLADARGSELWYGHADMHTGKRTQTEYGSLHAFFP